jgi:Bifunctional DNA primase/polymerase, N-terminal
MPTRPMHYTVPRLPGELDLVIAQVRALQGRSIPTVPLCRPIVDGWCTAHWHPYPCTDAGKRPLVTGYRTLADHLPDVRYPIQQIRRFFDCNLGLVVPRGMVVVEADSPEGEAEIVELAAGVTDSAPVRERRPGRGRGWLFCVGSLLGQPQNVIHAGRSSAIDILAAGSIFVVPPSVHTTGHRYSWVQGKAPWEVAAPPLPPALFQLIQTAPHKASVQRSMAPDALDLTEDGFTPGVSGRVAFLMRARTNLQRLWNGTGKRHGDPTASGYDFALAVELHSLKVPLKEIAEAIAARPAAHSTESTYCLRTASAARSHSKRTRNEQ